MTYFSTFINWDTISILYHYQFFLSSLSADMTSRKRKRVTFEEECHKSMAMCNTVYGPNCPVRTATSATPPDLSENRLLHIEGKLNVYHVCIIQQNKTFDYIIFIL